MPPPNLLLIFTDEQRADTMAAYGNTAIDTPNLNRLAATSTVFERAYVSQAVCTPSRSTIMTGLWPHASGLVANNVPLPASVPCLAEMLPPGVFATGYHGKWHLGDEIFAQHGFDDWVSIDDMYIPYYSPGRDRAARSSYHYWLTARGVQPGDGNQFRRTEVARLPERLSKPAFLAETVSRFIHEHASHPWVLCVNFLEPHMPFFGPRDGQYAPAEVALPGNFEAAPSADQPLKARAFERHYRAHGHSGLPLATEADWRRMIANYWGLCSLVDTHVGAILNALEDTGQLDETIVVYTSDHGDMMGSHRLIAKCVQFEEAVRVPLLIRLPGQSRPRRVAEPVSHIDLVPTLLDLLGAPAREELPGRSLAGVLTSDARPPGEVFIEWNGADPGAGEYADDASYPDYLSELAPRAEYERAIADPVRTVVAADGWKLNWSASGERELYDLAADPGETTNLAARPDAAPAIRRLGDRIRRWQEETADTVRLNERH